MEEKKKTISLDAAKDIYEELKGKTVQCLVNNEDGDLANGNGVVCGYKDKYLIVGFTTEYEGCIKSFTDNGVFLEKGDFLSYRFWNISNINEIPITRPFNLELAKAGKPVCTRDGKKARIICFDAKGDYPIIALIDNTTNEIDLHYTFDGKAHAYTESDYDLMMLPEKKEGWINIYNADTTFYYVDGRVFETKDEAVQEAKEEVEKEQREKNEYIDTIRVEWEE